jgi:tetratricopeptide (TPR) repeat protein
MELDQKIEIFSKRLAQDPHSRVFAPLADLLRQAGRWEDALELVDDGLGRHPNYVSALVIKGRTLMDAGRADQARIILGRVLELDGENFVVLRLMTEDARSRQAWDEAIPLLEKLVVLDPDDSRWPGALAEAKQFAGSDQLSGHEGSSFATMTLVDIYLAQGYRAKALEALNQMAAREPGRQDIPERIALVQAEIPSNSPGESGDQASTFPSPAASGVGPEGRQSARRSSEKKQFEEWIDRLRQEGGSST